MIKLLKSAIPATAITASELSGYINQMFKKATPELAKRLEGGRIAVAVSGGADSLALCALLRQLYPKERLIALYVHHNINSRGVSEDEAAVQAALTSLDVEGKTLHIEWKEGELMGLGKGQLQENLRERRYRLLLDAAMAADAKLVLTGHNLDDDLVTMLYRFSHGSGLDGLAGMKALSPFPISHPKASDFFVGHPLLGLTKERLKLTCQSLGVKWGYDISNDDLDFRRNAIMENLATMQAEGDLSLEGLQDMQEFFKQFRRDMQKHLESAFSRSIVLNRINGDATLVLNDEKWLRSRPVFTRVVGLLAQFGSGKLVPLRTSRLVEMHRRLMTAFDQYQIEQRKLSSILVARSSQSSQLQPFDMTKRVNTGQMTAGGATFYPLSRVDALRRIELFSKLNRRRLACGPAFLIQREPPTRINSQQAAFHAETITLTPGQLYCWDGRMYLSYTFTSTFNSINYSSSNNQTTTTPLTPPPPPPQFQVSFMTVADVREFEILTQGASQVRRNVYSYLGITPGTHLYQIPVIRQVGKPYMAFPTLRVQYPVDQYNWSCQPVGSAALISRFQCLP